MTPTILSTILEKKKLRVAAQRGKITLPALTKQARQKRETHPKNALRRALSDSGRINVIAEIKRASPSKGVINDQIDAAEAARQYARGGASAISVLTEEDFFAGSLKDLEQVRDAVSLPILRKDFILDEFQIFEAAAAGADAILLIAAMLDYPTLKRLYNLAEDELGMDALVEVHTLEELEIAARVNAGLIGVNNRNLNTFEVSLEVSRELVRHKPENALMVAESGLNNQADILRLKAEGYSGFLIGETLMKSGDPESELRKLISINAGFPAVEKGAN